MLTIPNLENLFPLQRMIAIQEFDIQFLKACGIVPLWEPL